MKTLTLTNEQLKELLNDLDSMQKLYIGAHKGLLEYIRMHWVNSALGKLQKQLQELENIDA